MDTLAALSTFIFVAEEGGFSRAAIELGLSKSAASRQISALEAHLGTRLLHRTTRCVSLTEPGQAYLDCARSILADLQAANSAVLAPQNEISGALRIVAPMAIGTSRLAPVLAAFLVRHPKLTADVVLADRIIDLRDEGFDLALRIVSPEQDPALLAHLGPLETGLYAAPDYLSRRGRPQAPSDLAQHACLVLGELQRVQSWVLRGALQPIAIEARLTSNNVAVIRQAALAGLGIAMLSSFVVTEDIKQGRLTRLLDGFEPKPASLCVEYPKGRVPPAKTRLFVEFLVEALRRDGL